MKIFVIDEVHQVLIDGLEDAGHEVDYKPFATQQEVMDHIGRYDGLVVRTKMQVDKQVLSKAVNMKFIGRAGAGLDNIDTGVCNEKGIICFNAGEANADAVGEHTLAMLLSLCTMLQKADKEVRAGKWDREGNRGWELKGKTLAIIGYGNTGKAVAQKISGFGVYVITYDKYLQNYSDGFATEASMEEIRQKADIISFHVPLTDETYHLVNNTWITGYVKNIVLLNLSRGKVINLPDLVVALKSGKIKACGLDVLENEKPETMNNEEKTTFNYLINSDNVVLSPHIGGWTQESYEKISHVLLQKIKGLTLNNHTN